MPRFTISQHAGSAEGEHFDLFLAVESTLKTWRLQRTIFDAPQPATRIDDHRLQYLDYEGPVTKNRGTVKVWDTGEYATDLWTDARVLVAVRGRRLRARLRLDAVKPGDPNAWLIADASLQVRKLATALLRESVIDAAPTDALAPLAIALSAEERSILGAVDAYAKGRDVKWEKVAADPALRDRIAAERARWRHPWLEAAAAHATRLEEIARSLIQGRA